jgi:hypothetical protein
MTVSYIPSEDLGIRRSLSQHVGPLNWPLQFTSTWSRK